MRVLVYERDGPTRDLLAAVARARGHEVDAHGDADAAWEAAQAGLHPLSILDWSAAEARELCAKLRAGQAGRAPVVLASGLTDRPSDLELAVLAGADDYMPKAADAGAVEARLIVAESRVRRRAEQAAADAGALRDARQALRESEERSALLRHGTFDALTGLPTRAFFEDRLARALARAHHAGAGQSAVLFLDLDGFKPVNDALGHLAGDELLQAVARRLERCVRPGDLVSRFGGDEFAIQLPRVAGVDDATRVASRIQGALAKPFRIQGHQVCCSASIGISLSGTSEASSSALLRDADAAMYRAKATAPGTFEVFDERMRAQTRERLGIERDLAAALRRGELRLVFQPVMRLSDRRPLAFEALLRWAHPREGVAGPERFLAVAEASGVIVEIGDWALRQACRQLRHWRDRLPKAASLAISVNVSARQLAEPAFAERVRSARDASGLASGELLIEVAEPLLARPGAEAVLARLAALGVGVVVDAFGGGRTSLRAIERLRPASLKLERELVGAGARGEGGRALRAALAAARELELAVVALGVESEEQVQALAGLGCNAGQGRHLSPPLDARGAATLLVSCFGGRALAGRRLAPRHQVETALPQPPGGDR
ncbi:MAG: putative bifunctional diguanylate cyclase/phosphodiesterase [Vicinamibacteria bacterium]